MLFKCAKTESGAPVFQIGMEGVVKVQLADGIDPTTLLRMLKLHYPDAWQKVNLEIHVAANGREVKRFVESGE